MSVQSVEDLTLSITLETRVRASLETTFASLLEQVGPEFETPEGRKLTLVLEPWPGGRWFRDLGDGNGHFWANVQAIKRPNLLEMSGPLFASSPMFSNLQYRLTEIPEGTLITVRHTAFGFVVDASGLSPAGPAHRDNMELGWKHQLERVRQHAEGGAPRGAGAGGAAGGSAAAGRNGK